MTWQRGARLFAYELLIGVLWLPTMALALASTVALPALVAWFADLERRRACHLDGIASGPLRAPQERLRAWLHRRRRSGLFLRQDVPMVALLQLIGLASMVLAVVFVSMAVFVPLQTAVDAEAVHLRFSARPVSPAANIAVAAVGACVAAAGLRGLASLRLRVVRAFSWSREEDLAEQVGRLARGRTTLVTAFEAEQRRIERDLHDGAQQQLVALSLELGRARVALRAPGGEGRARVEAALDAAQNRAEAALAALRDAVRRIHPAVIRERGLFAGIEDLVAHCGIRVRLTLAGDDTPVASPCAIAAYFVVAEALTNAARHSGADEVTVEVDVSEDFRLTVSDAGIGGADPDRGSGLGGLRERVDVIGGEFHLDSPPAVGTTIGVVLPLTPGWEVQGVMVP